jgi:predicted aspartyl protease
MLPIIVGHGNAPKQMVEALIDTGFSGLLSLPSSMIKLLGLPWIFSDSVRLGDGS